jgi:RNA polymerase sigma factor (sigma-70 family)
MSERGSISRLLLDLKAGDIGTAQPLWERYYRRLVGLARKKLGDAPRQASDEEDVVQSAFNSFFQRARNGQFPQLSDRDDLWRLLVVITARKAVNLRVHQNRAKRGAGKVRSQMDSVDDRLAQVIGAEPTPSFAAQLTEQLERIMNGLPDPTHRVIVLWKLEGRTNAEIAHHLSCSLASVERKLRLIRQQLESELVSEESGDASE